MTLRIAYLILFFISVGMMLYILFKSRKIRSEVAVRMSVLMGSFIVEAVACLILATVKSEETASLAFSFAFISTDVMLLYMYVLIRYFAKEPFTSKLRVAVLFSLITADCVSMFANVFTEHAFRVYRVFVGNDFFFQAEYLPGMKFRLVLMYFVCFLIVWALLKRVFLLPRVYSMRYLSVLFVLMVMFFWDAAYSLLKAPVNTEIFGNGIFAFVIFYCTVGYVPKQLFTNIFMKAVDEDRDGLLFFDADDECIFANQGVIALTGMGADKDFLSKEMHRWVEQEHFKLDENFTKTQTLIRDGKPFHLQVELQALRDKKDRKIGNLFRFQDITNEKIEAEKQRFLATHDTLTNAYNREGFYLTARELIDKDPERKRLILRFNYRDFKYVNNYFGLKKGDEILCNTVTILKEIMGKDAILARFYGDDFVMLTDAENYDENQYDTLLDRLSHNIVDTYYTIYTHMGVYEIEDSGMSVAQMCDNASLALENIKLDRGNRISYYSGNIMEQQLHEREIISRFEDALANGELRIYLQPQVDADGHLVSAEALARWVDPKKGLVLPGEFIPVLERNGLIYKLDRFVWGETARLLADWKEQGIGKEIAVSVNVSPRDIYYLNLYDIFTGFIEKYKIDSSLLKIELTESTLMRDRNRYTELIDDLHAGGFEIEMDDFGSGYSSLGILQDIPVDVLKIDRSFIREAETNDRSRIILGMVMSMAKKLHTKVIVEGVETRSQVYFLEAMGCKIFQGFFFAEPMPLEVFEEKYYKATK